MWPPPKVVVEVCGEKTPAPTEYDICEEAARIRLSELVLLMAAKPGLWAQKNLRILDKRGHDSESMHPVAYQKIL